MEEKKRISILAGESTLTEEEMAALDKQISLMRERNLLDAVERASTRSRSLAAAIINSAEKPRRGLNGPQPTQAQDYLFFKKCQEFLGKNGNNMEKAKIKIAEHFNKSPSTVTNRYYKLRKVFEPWRAKDNEID
jgi:hypothetical protein